MNTSSSQTHTLTVTFQTWSTSVICVASLTQTGLPPLAHFSQHERMTCTTLRFYSLWLWEPAWLTWLCFSLFLLRNPEISRNMRICYMLWRKFSYVLFFPAFMPLIFIALCFLQSWFINVQPLHHFSFPVLSELLIRAHYFHYILICKNVSKL